MLPKHIFREYDIRGLAEKELTDEMSRSIGQAFGTFLAKKKEGGNRAGTRVGVGHDLRPSSERIHKALVEGLTQAGSDVFDLGLIPTPLLYFGVVHFSLDAGISITGSHNPPQYNGFKFQLHDRPFYGADIQQLREKIEEEEAERQRTPSAFGCGGGGKPGSPRRGQRSREAERKKGKRGAVERTDILAPYLAELKQQFKYSKKWKIVIDCGHAMAGLVAPKLFKELGQDVIELYTNLDPKFPDHHPDPSVLENLEDLSNEVRRQNAHLGIAFDGDADRIGVVDELGNPFLGDRLLAIFARQVLKKKSGAAIVGDVKCSPLLYRDIEKRGGRPILWKTGHSLIKAKMKEEGAALGGEMSGHTFFADRWYGFDDAIYAACRMVEILDEEKRPVSELLADFPEVVSTPEIRVEVADDRKKFEIVEKVVAELKTQYKVIDLDGARLEFEDGFGLIRASNTQPVLVMRFEAVSQKRLDEIQSLVEEKIKKYA